MLHLIAELLSLGQVSVYNCSCQLSGVTGANKCTLVTQHFLPIITAVTAVRILMLPLACTIILYLNPLLPTVAYMRLNEKN